MYHHKKFEVGDLAIYSNPKSKYNGQVVEVTRVSSLYDWHSGGIRITDHWFHLVVVKFKKGQARWVDKKYLEHFLT